MKKKGFTLIELLAVIVILAIIALIITPIVSDIIESSKKAAAKRSVEGYISAANNAAAVSLIDTNGIKVTSDKYSFETGEDNEALAKVDISGKRPNYVYLEYDYQMLQVVLANFCYNGYAFDYDNGIIEDGTIDYCSVAFTNRPKIVITGEGELNSRVTIAIDYTETTVGKQYKIGNGEYIDYTEPFEIESSKELASQRDIHGNLKICAKATIESGESTEICRSINKLDLDYPETPTIDAAGGYPVITEYGIVTGLITVTPEPSNELTPYISFNGTEWIPYEVGMSALGNTIYAKVVKNGTGLESDITEITTTASADALNSNAYDGNRSTSDTFGYYNQDSHVKYIYVDENMAGKKISVYMSCGQYTNRGQIYFLDKDNKELQHNQGPESTSEVILTVPAGTTKIKFYQGNNQLYIYEIKFYDTPGITNSFTYPTITQSGVVAGHNKINITYASTSVQKLYKIGDGEWQNYTGTVNLPVGQTIYAKGINTYGIETEVSSYLSAAVANALTGNAYDGNRSTSDTFGYYNQSGHNKYIFIDESMIGKKISVYMSAYSPSTRGQIYFLDKDNKELQHSQGPESTGEVKFTVPAGTAKIKFYQGSQTIYVYEIGPAN